MDCCKHDIAADYCAICRAPITPRVEPTDTSYRTDSDRRYHAQSNSRNGREEWTQHEDRLVLASTHDPTLSRQIGRTIRAIQSRRQILK